MSEEKYRLVYFDIRALAEPLRWIFTYTGTPFVDERIPWDYTKFCNHRILGEVPLLLEDGGENELSQAKVISRYLARKFGLVGNSPEENATVEEVVSVVHDLFLTWRTMIMFERDPEERKANRQYVDLKFKLAYNRFNRILEEAGGDWVLGGKLTHADFWLASFVSIWDEPMKGDGPIKLSSYPCQTNDLTKQFPLLRRHKQKVHQIPQIKEWVAKRHHTLF